MVVGADRVQCQAERSYIPPQRLLVYDGVIVIRFVPKVFVPLPVPGSRTICCREVRENLDPCGSACVSDLLFFSFIPLAYMICHQVH